MYVVRNADRHTGADDVFARAASRQRKAEKTDSMELRRWLGEVSADRRLAVENQRALFREIDECWNLNGSGIQIHDEDLPGFYIGACVPVSIPESIGLFCQKGGYEIGRKVARVRHEEMGLCPSVPFLLSRESTGRLPFRVEMDCQVFPYSCMKSAMASTIPTLSRRTSMGGGNPST